LGAIGLAIGAALCGYWQSIVGGGSIALIQLAVGFGIFEALASKLRVGVSVDEVRRRCRSELDAFVDATVEAAAVDSGEAPGWINTDDPTHKWRLDWWTRAWLHEPLLPSTTAGDSHSYALARNREAGSRLRNALGDVLRSVLVSGNDELHNAIETLRSDSGIEAMRRTGRIPKDDVALTASRIGAVRSALDS
jgi:hypothetical protein